jgi:hypothetical protein
MLFKRGGVVKSGNGNLDKMSKDLKAGGSKSVPAKLYPRTKLSEGQARKVQTSMLAATHPFNPKYAGGKSQFVDPKKK